MIDENRLEVRTHLLNDVAIIGIVQPKVDDITRLRACISN